MNDSTMAIEKSTHTAEVVEIKLEKHPNADLLSVAKIFSYSYVAKTEDWANVTKALFIPPDSLVDTTRPEFVGLVKDAKYAANSETGGPYARIKTKKIRGIVSYGYMIPLPDDAIVGQDRAAEFGILHYDPPIEVGQITGGEASKAPAGVYPKYDVDSFQRWAKEAFIEGEPVAISEKINGCNGRYLCQNGEVFCGSRGEWKKEYPSKPTTTFEELLAQFNGDTERAKNIFRKIENWKPRKNLWWIALDNTPFVKEYCKSNPGFTVYGEVYGAVGGWGYNTDGKYQFVAFDILKPDGSWFDFPDFISICKQYQIPTVPIIEESLPFNLEELIKMADRNSVLFDHIAEGIVVHPVKERWNDKIGRVKLKIINPNY